MRGKTCIAKVTERKLREIEMTAKELKQSGLCTSSFAKNCLQQLCEAKQDNQRQLEATPTIGKVKIGMLLQQVEDFFSKRNGLAKGM